MSEYEMISDILFTITPSVIAFILTAILLDYAIYRVKHYFRERKTLGGSDRPRVRSTVQEK